jgi:alpha-ketoglutarate-dependent 2,4-dichlorophenoxyacetate dioxygenase
MEIVPIGPGFAAELRGVALAAVASDPALYRRVRAAFEEHSVLLFRDQAVTDAAQEAFSACFGPLELTKVASLGEGTHFSILKNIGPDGGLVPDGHRETLVARANQLWHTDSSFKTTPALASVLSARVIPPTGGETEFASTRLAWQRLPEALRARLERAYAWHDYAHSRGKIDPGLATGVEQTALPPVRWRLTWPNPANGRTALYVASHAFAIDGMDKTEAQTLLACVIEEATKFEFTYQHKWRAGDVIMWDNRATMHRGRPWPADQPRHVVRTTISATDADGLDQVRPKAA